MKDLEKAAEFQQEMALSILEDCDDDLAKAVAKAIKDAYIAGAKYAIAHAWVSVKDGKPDIEREVVALQKIQGLGFRVVYAHRPDPTGYVTIGGKHYYAKTYGKGGWNLKDIKYWLDVENPKR